MLFMILLADILSKSNMSHCMSLECKFEVLLLSQVQQTQEVYPPMQGGRDVHKGGVAGFGSGEGQSAGAATRHRVKIFNHHADQEVEVEVPEDRCA